MMLMVPKIGSESTSKSVGGKLDCMPVSGPPLFL
jgi:hypothetical protein